MSAVPSPVLDVGAGAAAVTAVLVLGGLLLRSRPARWLRRTLITEPLAQWFRAQVAHEVEPRIAEVRGELRPNGGTSWRDEVTRRFEEGDRRMCDIEAKVDRIEAAVTDA